MTVKEDENGWWHGFLKGQNFTVENEVLTVNIYDPPEYSFKEVKTQIDELTNFRRDLLIDPWWPKGFKKIRLEKLP